jgi:hypothetical protein
MVRKRVAAKTSKINRTTPTASSSLERYCRDPEGWPRSWMEWEKICHRARSWWPPSGRFWNSWRLPACRPKPFRNTSINIWALGGEIIRDFNETPSLRKKPIENLLFDLIDDEGGPLLYHCDSEDQQKSFDSTCRKLRRFLTASVR